MQNMKQHESYRQNEEFVLKKGNMRAVLLSREQTERLERIRNEEAARSAYGIRPTIHEVARKLIDEALNKGGRNA